MRGIKFGLSDTSIQDSTDRVILPVMDGLAMAAFSTPGGTGKNYSEQGWRTERAWYGNAKRVLKIVQLNSRLYRYRPD